MAKKENKYKFFGDTGAKELQEKTKQREEYEKAKKEREEFLKKKKAGYKDGGVVSPCDKYSKIKKMLKKK